jgi:glycine C-acetyltransferase
MPGEVTQLLHAVDQGDPKAAEEYYVIAFSYPVVPQAKARIRTQISAAHTREDLAYAVEKFAEVKRELGV